MQPTCVLSISLFDATESELQEQLLPFADGLVEELCVCREAKQSVTFVEFPNVKCATAAQEYIREGKWTTKLGKTVMSEFSTRDGAYGFSASVTHEDLLQNNRTSKPQINGFSQPHSCVGSGPSSSSHKSMNAAVMFKSLTTGSIDSSPTSVDVADRECELEMLDGDSDDYRTRLKQSEDRVRLLELRLAEKDAHIRQLESALSPEHVQLSLQTVDTLQHQFNSFRQQIDVFEQQAAQLLLNLIPANVDEEGAQCSLAYLRKVVASSEKSRTNAVVQLNGRDGSHTSNSQGSRIKNRKLEGRDPADFMNGFSLLQKLKNAIGGEDRHQRIPDDIAVPLFRKSVTLEEFIEPLPDRSHLDPPDRGRSVPSREERFREGISGHDYQCNSQ